jgi:hypothetical protein
MRASSFFLGFFFSKKLEKKTPKYIPGTEHFGSSHWYMCAFTEYFSPPLYRSFTRATLSGSSTFFFPTDILVLNFSFITNDVIIRRKNKVSLLNPFK